jgi:hypothetical protein
MNNFLKSTLRDFVLDALLIPEFDTAWFLPEKFLSSRNTRRMAFTIDIDSFL